MSNRSRSCSQESTRSARSKDGSGSGSGSGSSGSSRDSSPDEAETMRQMVNLPHEARRKLLLAYEASLAEAKGGKASSPSPKEKVGKSKGAKAKATQGFNEITPVVRREPTPCMKKPDPSLLCKLKEEESGAKTKKRLSSGTGEQPKAKEEEAMVSPPQGENRSPLEPKRARTKEPEVPAEEPSPPGDDQEEGEVEVVEVAAQSPPSTSPKGTEEPVLQLHPTDEDRKGLGRERSSTPSTWGEQKDQEEARERKKKRNALDQLKKKVEPLLAYLPHICRELGNLGGGRLFKIRTGKHMCKALQVTEWALLLKQALDVVGYPENVLPANNTQALNNADFLIDIHRKLNFLNNPKDAGYSTTPEMVWERKSAAYFPNGNSLVETLKILRSSEFMGWCHQVGKLPVEQKRFPPFIKGVELWKGTDMVWKEELMRTDEDLIQEVLRVRETEKKTSASAPSVQPGTTNDDGDDPAKTQRRLKELEEKYEILLQRTNRWASRVQSLEDQKTREKDERRNEREEYRRRLKKVEDKLSRKERRD